MGKLWSRLIRYRPALYNLISGKSSDLCRKNKLACTEADIAESGISKLETKPLNLDRLT